MLSCRNILITITCNPTLIVEMSAATFLSMLYHEYGNITYQVFLELATDYRGLIYRVTIFDIFTTLHGFGC